MLNFKIYSTLFIGAILSTTTGCQSTPINYEYSNSFNMNKLTKGVIFDVIANHSEQCKYVSLTFKNMHSKNAIQVNNIPTITHGNKRNVFIQQLPEGYYELLSGKCSDIPLSSGNQPETSLIGMKYWVKGLKVASDTQIVYPGTLIIGTSKLSSEQKKIINQRNAPNITSGERLPLNKLPVFENYKIEDNRKALALVIDKQSDGNTSFLSDTNSKYIYIDFANETLAGMD